MASGDEQRERATGFVNGANVSFSVSSPYEPGTLWVSPNGILNDADADDGWVETSPATGAFEMKVAPRPGDVVLVRYTEA